MTDRRSPMWRLLFLLISVLALSALVLAAACGDDDDDTGDDDDGGATATEPADNGDDDDDPTDEPMDGDDDDDDGGDDDPFAEIEDFAADFENATGVVTYTFTSDSDVGTWTIYTDGDNSRTDFNSEDGSFISITTPEASYTCTESDGEGFCFEGEGGIGSNPFAGLFTSFASSDAIFAYLAAFSDVDADSSSEEIAGVDANCYTLDGDFTGEEGTIKWCWADSGLMLLASYDLTSGLFEIRATEFSDSVPGGSFDPPYEVTSFGQ